MHADLLKEATTTPRPTVCFTGDQVGTRIPRGLEPDQGTPLSGKCRQLARDEAINRPDGGTGGLQVKKHRGGLIFVNLKQPNSVSKVVGGQIGYAAMEQANSRIFVLHDRIRHQIELVAELICAGESAVGAVQTLDRLTRELVAEEHRVSDSPRPLR